MKNFTLIKTVYKDETERTIEKLSDIYNDLPLLKGLMSDLVNNDLSDHHLLGKKILLKPNWVLHSRNKSDDICMRTNDNFLLSALEIVLEKKPSKVIIGDAPIQGCFWDKMITPAFYEKISELSSRFDVPVEIIDFRRRIFDPSKNHPISERSPISEYVIFDLGKESFLEPISSRIKNIFRVTNYDPERLAESHSLGMHKYCITKELFDVDIVISLPKVKTHQKTGLTCALKNLVGVNGDKDYLPHHRLGGVGNGGDCYPGKNYLRLLSELALDNANRNQGKSIYWYWIKISSLLWRLTKRSNVHNISAAWYGNDTTWRMVMDLNKIALLGKADGSIADKPQRTLFSLCDGIIGGQGDGPLRPDPLPLGIISFSNNSAITDICMAILMRFDYHKMPLLMAAYNLTDIKDINLIFNGLSITLDQLVPYSINTMPAPGWIDHLILKS
jgi:uncharacterized protein (DUF362 family)